MAFKNRGFLFAVLLVAAAAELVGNASAATYVVGDSLGWNVPRTPADYANWASRHTFTVGDVLVFNFTTGFHDVAQVTKASYDGCGSSNPLSLATVGPSNSNLSAPGETYYICTFGSHCSLGQKLAINVSATSTSPAPAPSTPTTPTPTPTPSRSPSPSPSPVTPTPTPTPTPVPSPGSAPAPTPSGSASPPPSGGSGPPPGSPTSPGDLSPPPPPPPPPPPSSATISTASGSLVGFAFVAVCLMI